MGVYDDAWFVVDVSPDDIGRFSADSGQRGEFFQCAGYFSSVLLHQRPGAGNNVFGFVMVKAGGMDVLLQFFQIRIGKFFQCVVFFK